MPISDTPSFGNIVVNPMWKIALIHTVWHGELTSSLMTQCRDRLIERGIPAPQVLPIQAPGSFEAPLFAKHALLDQGCDAVVVFGVIVQGATHHADLVAKEAARACMQLQQDTGKPVTFEILFVNTLDDARVRSTGKNSKGPLAADTVLTSLAQLDQLRS